METIKIILAPKVEEIIKQQEKLLDETTDKTDIIKLQYAIQLLKSIVPKE